MPKRNKQQEMERLYKIGQAKNDVLENFLSVYKERLLGKGEFIMVRGGMPEWIWTPENGEKMIITPETDINNEIVLEHIVEWQKAQTLRKNPPPQPTKVKGGKTDWLPLWKWARLHPQFTIKEIASLLHRDYTDVKRKLKALDNEAKKTHLFSSKSSI